jgi:heat shock protein HtpX
MRRYHLRRAVKAADLSKFEEQSLITGVLLVVVALGAAAATGDAGGVARALGWAGLMALGACAASRAIRLYLTGATASIPRAVGRGRVDPRPRTRRAYVAVTAALALGLPLGVAVAALSTTEAAWMLVAAVLLLGWGSALVTWTAAAADEPYALSCPRASELLRRLCIVADIQAPELVVEPGRLATAWTTRGRIHVTQGTLDLLGDAELEGVLAHEVAHLAHRDAAVMETCSAPSRLLIGFSRYVSARLRRWVVALAELHLGMAVTISVLLALAIPPAFVIGWLSRLSVLGLSRAREFSADAAAAALTGRPSALASALMKLEEGREWAPRSDLRRVEAQAVLCIVGSARPRIGRLFSTHPATAARVKRLEAIEARAAASR